MRFGMRLDGWMKPSACVEMAQVAEKAGFDAIWFAENPFGRGVLPTMVASGLATQRIQIGIGVLNPFQRHPSVIAMEMAALDEVIGGRSLLGIGAGIPRKLKQTELDVSKPIGALRDAITIIRALIAGEKLTYEGSVFSVTNLALEFAPIRKDYPIYMAAMGDQAIKLAGSIADGMMISNLCTPGFTTRALEFAASAPESRLRHVVQYAPCVVGPDRNAARAEAKDVLGRMIKESFGAASNPAIRKWHLVGNPISDEGMLALGAKLNAGDTGRNVLSDELLDLYVIAGDADDCRAAYERYRSVGVTEMVVTFRGSDPVADLKYLASAMQLPH